jgi:hypothetical protein
VAEYPYNGDVKTLSVGLLVEAAEPAAVELGAGEAHADNANAHTATAATAARFFPRPQIALAWDESTCHHRGRGWIGVHNSRAASAWKDPPAGHIWEIAG